MQTTSQQKAAILHDARNLVRMGIAGQRRFMSTEDYEELEADCLMAASRAIDDFDASMGCRLSSLMFRYIVQKRIKVLKHRQRRSLIVHDTESLGECCGEQDGRGRGCSHHHESMVQDMEIIIDRARNDDVITEREYLVLVARRGNVIYREIAEEMGLSFQRIPQIEAEAVEKIRVAYRTAE